MSAKIQDQVGTQPIFHIDAASERKFRVLARLFVIAREPIRLHNEQSSASDVLDAFKVSRLRYLRYPKRAPVRFPQVSLVLSADESFEIHTPQDIRGMCEIQRGKWNFDCGGPAIGSDLGVRGPNPVPAGIEVNFGVVSLFFDDEAVDLRT